MLQPLLMFLSLIALIPILSTLWIASPCRSWRIGYFFDLLKLSWWIYQFLPPLIFCDSFSDYSYFLILELPWPYCCQRCRWFHCLGFLVGSNTWCLAFRSWTCFSSRKKDCWLEGHNFGLNVHSFNYFCSCLSLFFSSSAFFIR